MSKQSSVYLLELKSNLETVEKCYYSISNLYKTAIAPVRSNIIIPILDCENIEKTLLTNKSCYIWKNDQESWAKVTVFKMEDCNDYLPWLKR